MIAKQDITGLILAGGRGTRMGNLDKGLQAFKGVPLALHALFRLQDQVACVLMNANQNLAAYEAFGALLVLDNPPDFSGPLAGFAAGLMHCDTPYLITVPCDSPLFPADLVQRLAQGLSQAQADCAYVQTADGYTHPVFCLMKTDVIESLHHFMHNDGRKIDAWLKSLKHTLVQFEDVHAFENVNTLEALRRLEH